MVNKEKITIVDMLTLANKINNWELKINHRHETYEGSFGNISVTIIKQDSKQNARMYAHFKDYWIGKAQDMRLNNIYTMAKEKYEMRAQSVRAEAIKRIREMTRPEPQVYGSGLLALLLQDADTALTGENISVLGESDEYNLKNDKQLNTPVPLENIEEDINLDSFGSGSGLLDLSLQADDTTLGGILDEIYTSENNTAPERSVEELEEDINLDSFGSPGLLDLSLQADDTSLGGILDEIYTAEEELSNILLKPNNTDNSKNKPKRHRRGPIRRLKEIFWRI